MKKRIIVFSLCAALAISPINVYADGLQDLQNEVNYATEKQNEALGEIDTASAEQAGVNQQIADSEEELVECIYSIETLEQQIADLENQIEVTENNLADAQEQESTQYEAMKKRIQYLYETGGDISWAYTLLNVEKISDILNQVEFTQKLYSYDRQCLEDYAATVQQVQDYKDQLIEQKSLLEASKREKEEQCTYFENLIAELNITSAQYDSIISEAMSRVESYQNEIDTANAEIQAYLAEQQRRIEEEQKRIAEQMIVEQQSQPQTSYADEIAEALPEGTSYGEYYYDAADAAADLPTWVENLPSADESYSEPPAATIVTPEYTYEPEPEVETPSAPAAPSYDSSLGEQIVATALAYVGYPYVYGGNSLTGGIDCSGFTQQIYGMFGISLSRSSWGQHSAGYAVSYAEAQPGDLICYAGHVAIYMGGGAIVHASNEINGICVFSNATYRDIVTVRRLV